MQKRIRILLGLGLALGLTATIAVAAGKVAPTANGIELPAGYRDWRVISVSHRTDNNSVRVILGNDVAVAAARKNQTSPWPEGAILGKVVWKDATDKLWDKATVPGELVHAEFMIKDKARFAATGGWGYARWKGMAQEPHGRDAASASAECVACHVRAKAQDSVFTRPAPLP